MDYALVVAVWPYAAIVGGLGLIFGDHAIGFEKK